MFLLEAVKVVRVSKKGDFAHFGGLYLRNKKS